MHMHGYIQYFQLKIDSQHLILSRMKAMVRKIPKIYHQMHERVLNIIRENYYQFFQSYFQDEDQQDNQQSPVLIYQLTSLYCANFILWDFINSKFVSELQSRKRCAYAVYNLTIINSALQYEPHLGYMTSWIYLSITLLYCRLNEYKLANQYLKKWIQILKKTNFAQKFNSETYLGYLGDTRAIKTYFKQLIDREKTSTFLEDYEKTISYFSEQRNFINQFHGIQVNDKRMRKQILVSCLGLKSWLRQECINLNLKQQEVQTEKQMIEIVSGLKIVSALCDYEFYYDKRNIHQTEKKSKEFYYYYNNDSNVSSFQPPISLSQQRKHSYFSLKMKDTQIMDISSGSFILFSHNPQEYVKLEKVEKVIATLYGIKIYSYKCKDGLILQDLQQKFAVEKCQNLQQLKKSQNKIEEKYLICDESTFDAETEQINQLGPYFFKQIIKISENTESKHIIKKIQEIYRGQKNYVPFFTDTENKQKSSNKKLIIYWLLGAHDRIASFKDQRTFFENSQELGNKQEKINFRLFEHNIKASQWTRNQALYLGFYTQNTFLHLIINRCLRTLTDLTHLAYIRFIFKQIFYSVKSIYVKSNKEQEFECYRGCYLSDKDIKKFYENKSKYIQIHGFLSTSRSKKKAEKFGPCLIEINVKSLKGERFLMQDSGYADLQAYSNFSEEKQVLFNPLNYFFVKQITQNPCEHQKQKTVKIKLDYIPWSKLPSELQKYLTSKKYQSYLINSQLDVYLMLGKKQQAKIWAKQYIKFLVQKRIEEQYDSQEQEYDFPSEQLPYFGEIADYFQLQEDPEKYGLYLNIFEGIPMKKTFQNMGIFGALTYLQEQEMNYKNANILNRLAEYFYHHSKKFQKNSQNDPFSTTILYQMKKMNILLKLNQGEQASLIYRQLRALCTEQMKKSMNLVLVSRLQNSFVAYLLWSYDYEQACSIYKKIAKQRMYRLQMAQLTEQYPELIAQLKQKLKQSKIYYGKEADRLRKDHEILADALKLNHQFRQALQNYQEASKHSKFQENTKFVQIRIIKKMIQCYIQTGQLPQAQEIYNQLTSKTSNRQQLITIESRLFIKKKNLQKCKQILEEMNNLLSCEVSLEALKLKCQIITMQSEKFQEKQEKITEFIEIYLKNFGENDRKKKQVMSQKIIGLLIQFGVMEKALQLLDELKKGNSKNWNYKKMKRFQGHIMYSLKKYNEAILCYNEAIFPEETNHLNIQIYIKLFKAHHHLQNSKQNLNYYQKLCNFCKSIQFSETELLQFKEIAEWNSYKGVKKLIQIQ